MKKAFRKIKSYLKENMNNDSIIYKCISKIYHKLSAKKWEIQERIRARKENDMLGLLRYNQKVVKNACNLIKGIDCNYIALYNPTWLGVANSTKGLFKNCIPLEELTNKRLREKVLNEIIRNEKIETVIFSQLVDGWEELIKELHDAKNTIKIKVIWHANNYETISDYTWNLKKELISMYNDGYVCAIGFVKKTMAEFYKNRGYNAYYFSNNVKENESNNIQEIEYLTKEQREEKKRIRKEKVEEKTKVEEERKQQEQEKDGQIKVGIYNAHSREIKNIYTQMLATKFFDNAVIDIVPSSEQIEEYAKMNNMQYTNVKHFIPTNELMERIKQNDINVYATFTECAPMFPMESFESGVPCLIGNNNDYFKGSKLRDYVCVDREDDPVAIYNKMKEVLDNKEEVITLYKDWKNNFNIQNEKLVLDFINA